MDGGSITFQGNGDGFDTSSFNVELYFKNSQVNFGGNTDTTFPPGIYYFDGTDLTLNGSKNVTGNDVLLFFDNGATMDTTGITSYTFTGASKSLYSGGQDGMLIYAARGNTGTFTMHGNSGCYLGGVVYLPSAEMLMTGNTPGTWAEGQLIIDNLVNKGNTDVTIKSKDYVKPSTPVVCLTQ